MNEKMTSESLYYDLYFRDICPALFHRGNLVQKSKLCAHVHLCVHRAMCIHEPLCVCREKGGTC